MDDVEESVNDSVNQDQFLGSLKGDTSSNNVSSCGSPLNQNDIAYSASVDAEYLPESTNDLVMTSDVQGASNQMLPSLQEISQSSPMDVSGDHSVPCSQPEITSVSPIAALVPTANQRVTTPMQLSQNFPPEKEDSENKVSSLSELSSVGDHLSMSYASKEGINQEEEQDLSEDDSCDSSYLQRLSYAVKTFNEHYQNSKAEEESSSTADSFSPEAFLSSIPLFKKLSKRRPANILPKPNTAEYSIRGQHQHFLTSSHGVSSILPQQFSVIADVGHGVPIAPKPDPNTPVSCYVLVVPTPVYYENLVPKERLQLLHEQEEANKFLAVPSDHEDKVTEVLAFQNDTTPLQEPRPMHPPDVEWTPRAYKQVRTPLPSTRVRVSPSPNKGSSGVQGSPMITVSTTTTPIQPLQGKKKKYVIVQGNNRHLKGLASHRHNFYTRTVEESHQPIYLQGLPPQGFRRLWKARENSSTEKLTKRSLEPLFCKALAPANQEATVPEIDKSPLTCITDKVSCDREVPQHESNESPEQNLPTQKIPDDNSSTPAVKEANNQDREGVIDSECQANNEEPLVSAQETTDEVKITPVSQGNRYRENRERKKVRDRKYDADLKKAFEQLRRVVPRLPRSYSRGLILQEAIKYIGNLEKKIQDAGLWPTLQVQDHFKQDAQSKGTSDEKSAKVEPVTVTEAERVLSSTDCTVPDPSNNVTSVEDDEAQPLVPEDETGSNSPENAPATLTSPILLSLSAEEGSFSFVNPEGATVFAVDCEYPDDDSVTVEEVPLSAPFQQVQLLSVDLNDDTPVLTPQSPEEALSQELTPRLIPLVEIPSYTESGDSSRQDLFVSVIDGVSTISQEGLSDLGVTLSPLLSPLGILLSPGGDIDHSHDPTVAVLVDDLSSAVDGNMAGLNAGVPGVCTDMTSIAASVEVTTDMQRKKGTAPSSARKRACARSRKRTAQTVPSLSPQQPANINSSSPCRRNRRVLQDNSNFEDPRSPVAGNKRGRRRKVKVGHSEQSFQGVDENSAFAVKQTHTPPRRVSGVILNTKRKTSSFSGSVEKKSTRRL